MDTRALDMLHDTGNEHVRAVGNGVHFQFGTHEIFIAQNGIFYSLRENDVHVAAHVLLGEGDRHVLSADYVRGTEQHRIFQPLSRFQSLVFGHDSNSLRARNGVFFEQCFETLSILRHVHTVGRRPEDTDSVRREIAAKIDCRLAAERNYDAVRFLHVDDVLDVLRGQRFEIQPVGRIEVGGNRFGIVVDDDDFVTQLLQRPYTMNGGIVKFDSLSDTDGTRTDNDNSLFLAFGDKGFRLVVVGFVVGRVEIRRARGEFRTAGIDHFEYRFFMIRHFFAAEFFDILIEISQLFTPFVDFAGQLVRSGIFSAIREFAFVLDKIFQLVQKPSVDLREREDFIHGNSAAKRLIDDKQSFVRLFGKPGKNLLFRQPDLLFMVERSE